MPGGLEDYPDIDREEERTDDYFEQAQVDIMQHVSQQPNRVFYSRQLEVWLEDKYFHWITNRAVRALVSQRRLAVEEVPLSDKTRIKFVFRKGLRYYNRAIKKSLQIVRQYSDQEVAEACGNQAELLFLSALVERRFQFHGRDVNGFQGKQWKETNHDLDFIVGRDEIVYGVEVKNRWDYIEREELEIKLRMCEFLGLRPLMIMRSLPKTYIHEVNRYGGFALLFEAQIYPYGSKRLVKDIQEVLGLKADCPRSIPSGIIDRFEKWHMRAEIKR